MPFLIIGSTAIRRWYPEFPHEPKDLDFWATTDEVWSEGWFDDFNHPLLDDWLNRRLEAFYQVQRRERTITVYETV